MTLTRVDCVSMRTDHSSIRREHFVRLCDDGWRSDWSIQFICAFVYDDDRRMRGRSFAFLAKRLLVRVRTSIVFHLSSSLHTTTIQQSQISSFRSDLGISSSVLVSFPPTNSLISSTMTIGSVLLAPSPSGEKTYGFMYYLKGAAAGGICCSITHGALTPVDVVKTRVQLDPVKVRRVLFQKLPNN